MGDSTTWTIRRAGPDDAGDVLPLIEEYCAEDGHEFDAAAVRAALDPLLADDDLGVVLVLELDGFVDGYVVVTWGWSLEVGGPEAVLDEIYVRRRNRGHGSALAEAAEAACRAREVRRIFLETELQNNSARRLYARLGYLPESSIWMAKLLT